MYGGDFNIHAEKANKIDFHLTVTSLIHQSGRMPVLEESTTMDYVTNHNMITMAMILFKTLKMADDAGKCRGINVRFILEFISTFLCLIIGKVILYG